MLEKYVLLDLENPNTRGNSICAIAVVLMENGRVLAVGAPDDLLKQYNCRNFDELFLSRRGSADD